MARSRILATVPPDTASGACSLSLCHVSFRYGPARGEGLVVDDLSLEVAPGEFVCLLGPSGCGKSTLLRLIAGLLRPSEGQIVIGRAGEADGAGPSPDRRATRLAGADWLRGSLVRRGDRPGRGEVGWVAQRDGLLPWLTTAANVALPLRVLGWPGEVARRRADEALRLVGLAAFGRHYPHQLSGGMRQRAALARAIVHQPALLLLDEPFAHLDELTRDELGDALVALWTAGRPTVVMVTHSALEAVRLADRVVVLAPRPARVIGEVRPTVPRPRSESQAGILAALREARALLRDGLQGRTSSGDHAAQTCYG